MIRNLVLKLPSLKCTSENAFSSIYRKRSFRSLSPVQRLRPVASAAAERSVSCSRAERGQSVVETPGKPQARRLCFSKEYYAENPSAQSSEIQWRENPPTAHAVEPPKEPSASLIKPDPAPFESLEQYELEAARPRPIKSREMIDTFKSQSQKGRYFHLQPNQMKPYGSQENMYSPMLIRPTNSLKYPRKFKRYLAKETHEEVESNAAHTEVKPTSKRGQRTFSTSTHHHYGFDDARELSTTKSCIAKEGHSTKDKTPSEIKSKRRDELRFCVPQLPIFGPFSRITENAYREHWASQHLRLDVGPPKYQPSRNVMDEDFEAPLEFSTPEMRRKRKEEQNRKGSRQYKASYSDLIKLKLKQKEEAKLTETIVNNDKVCVGCIFKNADKSNKVLDAFKGPPGRRSLVTRSKSSILSGDSAFKVTTNNRKRNFSKPTKGNKKTANKNSNKSYNPECEDICSPIVKALEKAKQKRYAYEPDKCERGESNTEQQKVYLPSKVKLPVSPHCSPRPEYRHCKKVSFCDIPRADDCLQIVHKPLPKIPVNKCPCIDEEPPSITPKLEKLNFKFEDPPRGICYVPPCQIPRADDSNPYKHKPLKPYVSQDCPCVQPPPMVDIKLKRLPRCEPEEVCRPVRVCPVVETCPPRADECYKIVPKKLPVLEAPECPCTETPPPKFAPSIKRLNLTVPEPERVCPKPPSCECGNRADECLPPKKKKLPKFVPGDCPCEDKLMVDWNPKRLVCEDEEQECIVPDPCKAFPRADWGCWEYSQEVCDETEEKCVEKPRSCVKKKEKPCWKKSICETGAGPLDYRQFPKRKFSNSSSTSSVQTYQRKTKTEIKRNMNKLSKDKSEQCQTEPNAVPPKKATSTPKLKSKKQPSAPALHLIKRLNDLEKPKSTEERLLFKPPKTEKIDYQKILQTIASTSPKIPKKETKQASSIPVKKPKNQTLTVSSRAISTTEQLSRNEADIQRERDLEAKEKCRKVKPTIRALMCQRTCPRYQVCPGPGKEHRPGCKFDRVPVCCTKEQPPYSSFSDNIDETIQPYTQTPQWTCNRMQFGFHPVYKKEHDPLRPKKKKGKKNYTTSSLLADLPIPEHLRYKELSSTTKNPDAANGNSCRSKYAEHTSRLLAMGAADPGFYPSSSKGFLKRTSTPNLSTYQNRTLTTKIFEIRPPVMPKKPKLTPECHKSMEKPKPAPTICCQTEETCTATRWGCKKPYTNTHTRIAPPFPAFSDCLDEEMEDILTECPLDKEKYLRMQPRFMNPPPKPMLLKPPPPNQGKIDVLKEQQCLRERFCLENEGVTQTCSDFGQPIPLMKSKKMIVDEKWDCKRMEELKKLGRWPPTTLKSTRHYSTTTANYSNSFRSFSTLGINSSNNYVVSENNTGVKRIYVRNYHALTKGANKAVLGDTESKLKEMAQKIFPNIDDSTKFIKLKSNQWKMQYPKMYEKLKRQVNIGGRSRRYYTTYKCRRPNRRRTIPRLNNNGSRRFSSSPLLSYRTHCYRGRRYFKSGRAKGATSSVKDRCRIKTHKKICPKFTLNHCPPRANRKKCHKVASWPDCSKEFSPYPAYSECKEHDLVAPTCECDFEVEKMQDLQPRLSVLKQPIIIAKEFPSQERIDRALGVEYYRCKHDIPNEGTTIGCDSFDEYFNPTPRRKRRTTRKGIYDENALAVLEPKSSEVQESDGEESRLVPEQEFSGKSRPALCIDESQSADKNSRRNDVVEFLVQDHQQSTTFYSPTIKVDTKPDLCEAVLNKKVEEICVSDCLMSMPCHLPEEEKYCICKAKCEGNMNEQDEPDKSQAEKPSDECPQRPTMKDCDTQITNKLKDVECIAPTQTQTYCPVPHCTDIVPKLDPCENKKSKPLTQLEWIWQRAVNYFKARPNCPQPGDYKKKALKMKAEKAATAAGLVLVDPKCIPPELVEKCRANQRDCRGCPNQDPCEPKRTGTRSCSPEANRKNFSTNFQPSRSYSKSMSCKNLDEINKILEEGEAKRRELNFRDSDSNMKKEYARFSERKNLAASEALKMSLDMALHKPVDLTELWGKYPKTYFGYSDIIPSRENILERAWRISIETYNRCNYPKNYNLFNEIFTRVEKSIKTIEDLEKLKTENVLRELDEFLKSDEPDTKKKK